MRSPFLVPATAALLSVSCVKVPSAKNERESGQSKLMDDTFAGKNKCSPENHDRPFIVEWDATDMSSFESYAANDVVMVRYEGCTLKVIDTCRDDSIHGALGSYKAVEWTSGSLESLDISDENELYAKLPLGQASLGGRVRSGEKFKMEYYVAGTRSATRSKIFAGDLKKVGGCDEVTHFVYAYNLGAFALGSVQSLDATVGGSIYGFGAGANKSTSRKADKKGGDLATCKSDVATEVAGCKAPIRLTLRGILEGDNPSVAAAATPDTPESLNAAAQIQANLDMKGEAGDRIRAAQERAAARDGKACLAELDKFDKLEPKQQSTDPKSPYSGMRGQCLMIAGKCDAGKQLWRKYYEKVGGAQMGPEQIDRAVEGLVGMYCQGGSMQPRDQMLRALADLNSGAYMTKKDEKFCLDAYKTVRKLHPSVKPRDDDDTQIRDAPKVVYNTAANCLARAGKCESAWKVFKESYPTEHLESVKDPAQREQLLKSNFESLVDKCKGKA
jgi:pentatricopeptide repeat protein